MPEILNTNFDKRVLCKHVLSSGGVDGLVQQTLRIGNHSVIFIWLSERDVSYIPHVFREIRLEIS